MTTGDGYIPYETLCREEAHEITEVGGAMEVLCLHPALYWKLQEILADCVARGIELGFAMSDFSGENTGDLFEAYNAGIQEGIRLTTEGE